MMHHAYIWAPWTKGMVLVFLHFALACTNAQDSKKSPSSVGTSKRTSATGSDGPGNGNQASGTDTEEEFPPAQQPVPLMGSNLVDYDNARVRCDYRETTKPLHYEALCLVVIKTQDGGEVPATGVKEGVDLSWQDPKKVRGDLKFGACSPAGDGLSFKCQVEVQNPRTLAEVTFGIKLKDADKPPRVESAGLMLPFSVGIAGGFVPGMPYRYQGQMDEASASLKLQETTAVGFQQLDFPQDRASFSFPPSLCLKGQELFFVSGYSVYAYSQGRVRLYAGSGNSQNYGNTSHRLRTFLLPQAVFCLADGVLVSSPGLGQIIKLTDAGTVTVIAGSGEQAEAQEGVPALTSPVGFPGGLVQDSSGNIYFFDMQTSRLRVIGTDGLVRTVVGAGSAYPDVQLGRVSNLSLGADDSVYFADTLGHSVYRYSKAGKFERVVGNGQPRYQGGDAHSLSEPLAVVLSQRGDVYVSEAFRGIKLVLESAPQPLMSLGDEIDTSTSEMMAQIYAAASLGQASPHTSILAKRPDLVAVALDQQGVFYFGGPLGIYTWTKELKAPQLLVGAKGDKPDDCDREISADGTRFFEASALTVLPNNNIAVLDWRDLVSDQLLVRVLSEKQGDFLSRTLVGCRPVPELAAFNPTMLANGQTGNFFNLGGLTAHKDGSLYIANLSGNLVVRLGTDGSIRRIAGDGSNASTLTDGPATTSSVQSPTSGAFDAEGNFYFVELGAISREGDNIGGRLRKVSPSGLMSIVAGNGQAGDSKHGDIAKNAPFVAAAIAVTKDGRIFFAETPTHKIKMIDQQGIIHLIAGGGSIVAQQTPIDAKEAQLSWPISLGVTNDDTVYFVNFGTNQVLQLRRQDNSEVWELAPFFGVKRSSECGTARLAGAGTASELNSKIRNSLTIICEGTPRAVAVHDSCPAAGGSTRVVISQTVNAFANVIEVVKPCDKN